MALHKLSPGNSEQSSAVCYVVFCESMKGGGNILAEPRQGGLPGDRRGQEADRRTGGEAAAGKKGRPKGKSGIRPRVSTLERGGNRGKTGPLE